MDILRGFFVRLSWFRKKACMGRRRIFDSSNEQVSNFLEDAQVEHAALMKERKECGPGELTNQFHPLRRAQSEEFLSSGSFSVKEILRRAALLRTVPSGKPAQGKRVDSHPMSNNLRPRDLRILGSLQI